MRCRSFAKLSSIMEAQYVFYDEQRLKQENQIQCEREHAIDELRQTTDITELSVLTELVDCGIRAGSLNVITLVPLVTVAWANGFIERKERLAVLDAAASLGTNPESPAFELLGEWLKNRPAESLLTTWKDYIGAIRLILSEDAFLCLRDNTIAKATLVAESAGGFFGTGAISKAEGAAIEDLAMAFS